MPTFDTFQRACRLLEIECRDVLDIQ